MSSVQELILNPTPRQLQYLNYCLSLPLLHIREITLHAIIND
jgi:hypothetical protein